MMARLDQEKKTMRFREFPLQAPFDPERLQAQLDKGGLTGRDLAVLKPEMKTGFGIMPHAGFWTCALSMQYYGIFHRQRSWSFLRTAFFSFGAGIGGFLAAATFKSVLTLRYMDDPLRAMQAMTEMGNETMERPRAPKEAARRSADGTTTSEKGAADNQNVNGKPAENVDEGWTSVAEEQRRFDALLENERQMGQDDASKGRTNERSW